jgi:hypothetical protein
MTSPYGDHCFQQRSTEVEDIFDAVLEWMLMPDAQEIYRRRQMQITANLDTEEA